MHTIEPVRWKRPSALLAYLAAAFVLAGGFIHLREWLETYRDVPAAAPGSAVVRVGFLVNTGISLLAAAALVVVIRRRSWVTLPIIVSAFLFEAASLATLIATRTGSVLGWSEPTWTSGASQTRAVEIAALLALGALAGVVSRGTSEGVA